MVDLHPFPNAHPTDQLIGGSPAMASLREQIRHLASFDSPGSPAVPAVLLQGETGTGKGLVARVLHESGPRAEGPLIELNCAAIPEAMLEAELFGFEVGAFTDAKRDKPGLFEAASGGTLLFDEMDALPLALQSKLLTALEVKRVRRLGAVRERFFDVKLVAATASSLPEAIAAGRFRADLYHRLAVVVLTLPPLRGRPEDILPLVESFLRYFAAVHEVAPKRLDAAAQGWLQSYDWPGNVRELRHMMERVTLLHTGQEVDAEGLARLCLAPPPRARARLAAPSPLHQMPESALPVPAAQIRQALVQTAGNVTRAARLLGISRDTMRYRMQRYGISRPRFDDPPAPGPLTPPQVGTDRIAPFRERPPAAEASLALEPPHPSAPTPDRAQTAGSAATDSGPLPPPPTEQCVPSHSPFVGREQELMLLQSVLDQVKLGQGQVVSLVGAAGMGKSRLLNEFRERLGGHRVTYGEGQCLAYGTAVPYLPIANLLQDHCGINPGDTPEVLITKVSASLERTGLEPDTSLPYLLHLLGVPAGTDRIAGLSAEARRAHTFETFRRLFFATSQRQPLVLAVENIHWIDPTSEALLASFVEGLAGVPILVLVTFRPGYRPLWGDRSYASQIALQPLTATASRGVIQAVLVDHALTPTLEQQLIAKAEGNPFFLEELAHTVRERGAESLSLAVPDTIQAVLAARIDRLPTAERHLLQAASVIGKDVAVPLLQALVAQPEDMLGHGLAHLQAAEFLFPTGFGPNLTYTFKHILTQEAVYQSVPGPTRRRYHQQVAQVLAERFPTVVAGQPELLAHHYTEAGLGEQAIRFWQLAGQRALERSANLEAISHLTKGLEVLKTLPNTRERARHELDLQTALGPALIANKGYAAMEVERTYARAHELCRQVEGAPQLVLVLFGLRLHYQQRAKFRPAQALELQLYELAQRRQDPALLLLSHQALGTSRYWLGEFAQARTHLQQGIALYDLTRHRALAFGAVQNPGITCLAFIGRVLWTMGLPDQALRHCETALALAREQGHPFTVVYALACAAVLHQFRREWSAVRECAEAMVALAREQGFSLWLAMGTILSGWAIAAQGQREQGMGRLYQGLAAYRATGTELARSFWLALLAEAHLNGGQVGEGLRALDEALAAVHATGERCFEAELYRLQGELLLALPAKPHAEAEAAFCQALATARRQQAKSLELRSAVSLSRLWQAQGKRDEAQQLLRQTYGWFTEGFGTVDLQEAKALMAALG
jgi:DNA-binding NtrC family response regulator/predicted ATPase